MSAKPLKERSDARGEAQPKPLHPYGENIRTDASWLPGAPNTTRTEAEPHTTVTEPGQHVVVTDNAASADDAKMRAYVRAKIAEEIMAAPPYASWLPNREEAEPQNSSAQAEEQYFRAGSTAGKAVVAGGYELMADGASGDAALEVRIAAVIVQLFQLFKDRQRKYGPANIAAFGDAGVCVRVHDKLARLRHHYFGGGAADMPDESVDDAWRDLAVYAVIALVCREGGWPGWKAVKP